MTLLASLIAGCQSADTVAGQLAAGDGTIAAQTVELTSTTSPTASARPGLRVTLTSTADDALLASTSSSFSTTSTTAAVTTTTTTASTIAAETSTTASTTTTAASTIASTNDSASTSTTASGSTTSGSPTTAPPPTEPANNFPDATVLRHADGLSVSFADQVAGSTPVLVWFWLPG